MSRGRPVSSVRRPASPTTSPIISADFVIVNGENAVEGYGITGPALERIIAAGADIVTSGNHVWEKGEFWETLGQHTAYGIQIMKGVPPCGRMENGKGIMENDRNPAPVPLILRPANYPAPAPGAGAALLEKNGQRLLVINMQGREYMTAIDCPFRTADVLLNANPGVPAVIDFHAESPAEKEALGLYLDSRASVVAGTNTHVQTADAKILPGGTAYITDLGMTGPTDGVIGMDAEICLARVKTQVLYRMRCADGPCAVQGIAVTFDANSTNNENSGGDPAASSSSSSSSSIEAIWLNVDLDGDKDTNREETNTNEARL